MDSEIIKYLLSKRPQMSAPQPPPTAPSPLQYDKVRQEAALGLGDPRMPPRNPSPPSMSEAFGWTTNLNPVGAAVNAWDLFKRANDSFREAGPAQNVPTGVPAYDAARLAERILSPKQYPTTNEPQEAYEPGPPVPQSILDGTTGTGLAGPPAPSQPLPRPDVGMSEGPKIPDFAAHNVKPGDSSPYTPPTPMLGPKGVSSAEEVEMRPGNQEMARRQQLQEYFDSKRQELDRKRRLKSMDEGLSRIGSRAYTPGGVLHEKQQRGIIENEDLRRDISELEYQTDPMNDPTSPESESWRRAYQQAGFDVGDGVSANQAMTTAGMTSRNDDRAFRQMMEMQRYFDRRQDRADDVERQTRWRDEDREWREKDRDLKREDARYYADTRDKQAGKPSAGLVQQIAEMDKTLKQLDDLEKQVRDNPKISDWLGPIDGRIVEGLSSAGFAPEDFNAFRTQHEAVKTQYIQGMGGKALTDTELRAYEKSWPNTKTSAKNYLSSLEAARKVMRDKRDSLISSLDTTSIRSPGPWPNDDSSGYTTHGAEVEVIQMKLPDGQTVPVHRAKLPLFMKKYPQATQSQ